MDISGLHDDILGVIFQNIEWLLDAESFANSCKKMSKVWQKIKDKLPLAYWYVKYKKSNIMSNGEVYIISKHYTDSLVFIGWGEQYDDAPKEYKYLRKPIKIGNNHTMELTYYFNPNYEKEQKIGTQIQCSCRGAIKYGDYTIWSKLCMCAEGFELLSKKNDSESVCSHINDIRAILENCPGLPESYLIWARKLLKITKYKVKSIQLYSEICKGRN